MVTLFFVVGKNSGELKELFNDCYPQTKATFLSSPVFLETKEVGHKVN